MAQIVTKTDHGEPIIINGVAASRFQLFIDDLVLKLNADVFGQAVQMPSYTVVQANALVISPAGAMIFVSNETGGAVMAFSDGISWRRVTDRAVIS